MPINYFPSQIQNNSEIIFGENLGNGSGVFKEKSGSVLRFRSMTSTGSIITLIETQNELQIGFEESNIDLGNCNNMTSEFISNSDILNENDFVSNSQSKPPSQASVKNYIEQNTKLENELNPKLTANAEVQENLVVLKPNPAINNASGIAISGNIISNSFGIGAALYLRNDGNYEEAGASEASANKAFGLALESGTGTKNILLYGTISSNIWAFNPGDRIFLSQILGDINIAPPNNSGDNVQMVGYALSPNTIYFNPSLTEIELN